MVGKNHASVKTAAIVTNNDAEYGLQSAATYKAAFEVEGIDVVDVNLHGFDIIDFTPIVSSILAKKPKVTQALKSNTSPEFVFGGGKWWGSQLWGQDNAVVGRWPVVVVQNGKARIQEFRSVSGWLDKNKAVLIKHMKELGLRTV